MSKAQDKSHEITFTPAQLDYLETTFPSVVLGPNATEAQMRYHFGQQSVIERVRSKTRGLQARNPRASSSDIPPPR